MARYEHLPVYRAAFSFAAELNRSVASFQRYHKYGIGEDLRKASYEILWRIVSANNAENKSESLFALRDSVEKASVLCRLAFELNAFVSIGNYERSALALAEVSRQSEGWLRSVRSAAAAKNPSRAESDRSPRSGASLGKTTLPLSGDQSPDEIMNPVSGLPRPDSQ